MDDRILFVDDDPKILDHYRTALRGDNNIICAQGVRAGLEMLAKHGPFALVVVDLELRGLDGIRFLDRVSRVAPGTVRMLTVDQSADMETAIEAVNRGGVFRVIKTPCPNDVFARYLAEGIEQYRANIADRRLLAETLRGNIKMLTDLVAAVSPLAADRTERIRTLARRLGESILPDRIWLLDLSALLAQVGYLNIPKEIVEKYLQGSTMSESEQNDFRRHPQFARELLANIPQLEKVGNIISYQEKPFKNDDTKENEPTGTDIPIESRILKICSDYDRHCSQGFDLPIAIALMKDRAGMYDPAILAELERLEVGDSRYEIRRGNIGCLIDGGILLNDIETNSGTVLCRSGITIDHTMKARLINHAKNQGISGKITIAVPVGQAEENEPQEEAAQRNVPHMLLMRGDRRSHGVR